MKDLIQNAIATRIANVNLNKSLDTLSSSKNISLEYKNVLKAPANLTHKNNIYKHSSQGLGYDSFHHEAQYLPNLQKFNIVELEHMKENLGEKIVMKNEYDERYNTISYQRPYMNKTEQGKLANYIKDLPELKKKEIAQEMAENQHHQFREITKALFEPVYNSQEAKLRKKTFINDLKDEKYLEPVNNTTFTRDRVTHQKQTIDDIPQYIDDPITKTIESYINTYKPFIQEGNEIIPSIIYNDIHNDSLKQKAKSLKNSLSENLLDKLKEGIIISMVNNDIESNFKLKHKDKIKYFLSLPEQEQLNLIQQYFNINDFDDINRIMHKINNVPSINDKLYNLPEFIINLPTFKNDITIKEYIQRHKDIFQKIPKDIYNNFILFLYDQIKHEIISNTKHILQKSDIKQLENIFKNINFYDKDIIIKTFTKVLHTLKSSPEVYIPKIYKYIYDIDIEKGYNDILAIRNKLNKEFINIFNTSPTLFINDKLIKIFKSKSLPNKLNIILSADNQNIQIYLVDDSILNEFKIKPTIIKNIFNRKSNHDYDDNIKKFLPVLFKSDLPKINIHTNQLLSTMKKLKHANINLKFDDILKLIQYENDTMKRNINYVPCNFKLYKEDEILSLNKIIQYLNNIDINKLTISDINLVKSDNRIRNSLLPNRYI